MVQKAAVLEIQKADDTFVCLPTKSPKLDTSKDTQDVTDTCSPGRMKEFVVGALTSTSSADGSLRYDDGGALNEAQQILHDAHFGTFDSSGNQTEVGSGEVTIRYWPAGKKAGFKGYQQNFLVSSWSMSGAVASRTELSSSLQGTGAITLVTAT